MALRIHNIIRLSLVTIMLVLSVPFALLLPAAIADPCRANLVSFECQNAPSVRAREFENGIALLLALIALGANEYFSHGRRPKEVPRQKDAYWDSKPRYRKDINPGGRRTRL